VARRAARVGPQGRTPGVCTAGAAARSGGAERRRLDSLANRMQKAASLFERRPLALV